MIQPVLYRPDECKIEVEQRGQSLFVSVKPAAADMSRLIGADGVNIKALKRLAEFYGSCLNYEARLTLIDPPHSNERAPRVPINPQWNPRDSMERIRDFLHECGISTEILCYPGPQGWRLTCTATFPVDIFKALNRWLCVMAMSQGGSAFLDESAREEE